MAILFLVFFSVPASAMTRSYDGGAPLGALASLSSSLSLATVSATAAGFLSRPNCPPAALLASFDVCGGVNRASCCCCCCSGFCSPNTDRITSYFTRIFSCFRSILSCRLAARYSAFTRRYSARWRIRSAREAGSQHMVPLVWCLVLLLCADGSGGLGYRFSRVVCQSRVGRLCVICICGVVCV